MTNALVLDLDGVVYDSKNNMSRSWQRVCEEHGLTISFSDYLSLTGRPFKKILEILGIPEKIHGSVANTYFSASENNEVAPFPGMIQAIETLERELDSWSVLTGKPLNRVSSLLEASGLRPSVCITPDHGLPGKPSPLGLLEISRLHRVAPSEIMYVGDMEVDFLAAKSSGASFLWAGWGYGIPSPDAEVVGTPQQLVHRVLEWKKTL